MNRTSNEIDRAVIHCNELETNIEGCLQVLQKICVKKPKKCDKQDEASMHITKSEKTLPKLAKVEKTVSKKAAQTTLPISATNKRADVTYIFAKTKQKLERLIERQQRMKELLLSNEKCRMGDEESRGKAEKSTLLEYASGDGSTDDRPQLGADDNNQSQLPTCDGDASTVSA